MGCFRIILVTSLCMFLAKGVTASEVTFSGDARVRYILKYNYGFGNFDLGRQEFWDSRVRVNLHAKATGGAYAKARMRLVDQRWNGARERKNSDTLWIGYSLSGDTDGANGCRGRSAEIQYYPFLRVGQ